MKLTFCKGDLIDCDRQGLLHMRYVRINKDNDVQSVMFLSGLVLAAEGNRPMSDVCSQGQGAAQEVIDLPVALSSGREAFHLTADGY